VAADSITPPAAKQRIEAAAPPSIQVVRYPHREALLKASAEGGPFAWITSEVKGAPGPKREEAGAADHL